MPLEEKDCAATYKILILGENSVGKTAILNSLVGRDFKSSVLPTSGKPFGLLPQKHIIIWALDAWIYCNDHSDIWQNIYEICENRQYFQRVVLVPFLLFIPYLWNILSFLNHLNFSIATLYTRRSYTSSFSTPKQAHCLLAYVQVSTLLKRSSRSMERLCSLSYGEGYQFFFRIVQLVIELFCIFLW